jgi:hypothetical protein
MSGKPVTEFVSFTFDRLCSFVEEFGCHCLRGRLAKGLDITELARPDRASEAPVRFQITFSEGGLPRWRIKFHAARFDET